MSRFLRAGLIVAFLVISGCGSGQAPDETPRPESDTTTASSPPPVEVSRNATYADFQALADAYQAAGGTCTEWSDALDPSADIQQWECTSQAGDKLYLETPRAEDGHMRRAIGLVVGRPGASGSPTVFLWSPKGWAISSDATDLEQIQGAMGGWILE